MERHPQPEGVLVVEGGEGGRRVVVAVHLVDGGDPDGVLAGDGVPVPAEALGASRHRDRPADQLDGGALPQLAGRAAVVVADDAGAVGEGAGPVDAGRPQGGGVGEAGVEVEGVQQHRAGPGGVVDQVVVPAPAAERRVLQGEAEHPAVADPAPLGRQRDPHAVAVGDPVEVQAPPHLGAGQQVLVAVDEPGGDRSPAGVEDLGAGVAALAHLGVRADRDDHPVGDRHRCRPRGGRVHRAHPGADDGEVDRHQAPPTRLHRPVGAPRCESPRAASTVIEVPLACALPGGFLFGALLQELRVVVKDVD